MKKKILFGLLSAVLVVCAEDSVAQSNNHSHDPAYRNSQAYKDRHGDNNHGTGSKNQLGQPTVNREKLNDAWNSDDGTTRTGNTTGSSSGSGSSSSSSGGSSSGGNGSRSNQGSGNRSGTANEQ